MFRMDKMQNIDNVLKKNIVNVKHSGLILSSISTEFSKCSVYLYSIYILYCVMVNIFIGSQFILFHWQNEVIAIA